MNVLDQLLRLELYAFLLEGVRILGVVLIAPLAWSVAPVRVRAGLVLLLTVVAHGRTPADPSVGQSLLNLVFALCSEFVVGLSMGFVVRLGIAVAEVAAEAIGPLIGLGVAQVFDPSISGTQTVLAKLFRHFAILLAVVLGVHRVVLGAVLASFRVLPPGTASGVHATVPSILELSANTLAAGVRIAVPIIAILFMTQVALAFISRAAPAMQIFSIGFAVTLIVGMSVLILAAPDMGHQVMSELSHTGRRIEELLLVLSTG
ncbi:MAG: flagellar biosynthetic protein FliR [Polyangiaceae bacterium]